MIYAVTLLDDFFFDFIFFASFGILFVHTFHKFNKVFFLLDAISWEHRLDVLRHLSW